jgi:hypothetical protein
VSDVTLRFYGRFAFAERGPDGIFALAPNFTAPFAKHDVRMSIRQDHVLFEVGSALVTTFDPSLRIASDVAIPDPRSAEDHDPTPEVLVWDLSGVNVSIGAPSPSTLQASPEPPLRLRELNAFGGSAATLKASALAADPSKESNAVIAIHNGTGKARAMDPSVSVNLAPRAAVEQGPPAPSAVLTESGAPITRKPADFVDFTIPLGQAQSLTISCTTGGTTKDVVLLGGATVCFSNLCAPLKRPDRVDLEFAQYYNLLESQSASPQVVPVEQFAGTFTGEGMGCYMVAQIE